MGRPLAQGPPPPYHIVWAQDPPPEPPQEQEPLLMILDILRGQNACTAAATAAPAPLATAAPEPPPPVLPQLSLPASLLAVHTAAAAEEHATRPPTPPVPPPVPERPWPPWLPVPPPVPSQFEARVHEKTAKKMEALGYQQLGYRVSGADLNTAMAHGPVTVWATPGRPSDGLAVRPDSPLTSTELAAAPTAEHGMSMVGDAPCRLGPTSRSHRQLQSPAWRGDLPGRSQPTSK